MIIKVDDIYHSKVINYLKREPDFNLFIIGDIERYGYDNYFLDIWADIDKKGHIEGVLLRYFEYLIFYSQGKNIKLCFTSYNENDCFLMASPIINIKRVINLEYNVVIRFLQGN